MYDYANSPMALLQLMNNLEKSGFQADFKLSDGLEITISKTRKPLLNKYIRAR